MLGGNSLGGGRGSVAKAVLGTVIVLILSNALLALAVARFRPLAGIGRPPPPAAVKWMKNRFKAPEPRLRLADLFCAAADARDRNRLRVHPMRSMTSCARSARWGSASSTAPKT